MYCVVIKLTTSQARKERSMHPFIHDDIHVQFQSLFHSYGFCLLKKQTTHQINHLHNNTCSIYTLVSFPFNFTKFDHMNVSFKKIIQDCNVDLHIMRMRVDILLGSFLCVSSVHGKLTLTKKYKESMDPVS